MKKLRIKETNDEESYLKITKEETADNSKNNFRTKREEETNISDLDTNIKGKRIPKRKENTLYMATAEEQSKGKAEE